MLLSARLISSRNRSTYDQSATFLDAHSLRRGCEMLGTLRGFTAFVPVEGDILTGLVQLYLHSGVRQ